MNNIKTLLFLDLWKIKNMIIQIIKNPVLFLKKLFSIVLFFGICFSTIIVSIFKNDSKLSIDLEIQQSILGIISLVSFLIILFVISHYLNDYAPSNFSVPDINYLFPSPIDNKIILFYSMIKSGLKGVLNFFLISLYALLFILAFTNLSLIGLIPIAIGFFFIFLFFITLSYLFFAIKVTFNFTKKLKILSYITQVIAIIIVSFYFYKLYTFEFNIYMLGNNLYEGLIIKLPIISSIINFISNILTETTSLPIADIILLLLLSIINCSIFLYLNVDYYEEISEKVSVLNERIKKLKNNKVDIHSEIEKDIKKVNLNISSKERIGVLSFHWKASVIRKRKQTSIKKYLYFIINIIIGIFGGVITIKGAQLESLLIISLGTVYISLFSANFSALSRELKNMYIYLLPGKPISKILSTVLDELIILFIRISIMLLPSIILNSKYLILGIGCYFLTILTTLVIKLLNLIIILLTPKEDTTKPGFIATFVLMIVIMIPFMSTLISYIVINNIYISFCIFFLFIITYLFLLILLSNKIFDLIEY